VGSKSSHQREELTCPDCGSEFTFAVPSDSEVPIPCPECGAATPVVETSAANEPTRRSDAGDGDSDAETKTTAHGLPGRPSSEQTAEGSDGESGVATHGSPAPDREDPRASTAHGLPGHSGEHREPEGRGDSEAESSGEATKDWFEEGPRGGPFDRESTEAGSIHSSASLDPDPDGTLLGTGPRDRQSAIDEDDSASNAEEAPESGESEAPQTGSAPPPRELDEFDESEHGAVTREVESVPNILSDVDGDDEASESGEATADRPPVATRRVDAPTESADSRDGDETASGEPASDSPAEGASDFASRPGSAPGTPIETRPEEGTESESTGSTPRVGSPALADTDDDLGEEGDEREEGGASGDSEGSDEREPDARPVRRPGEIGYRVDPSTNLEVAADEAISDGADEESGRALAPNVQKDREREVLELREQIPDEPYRVRIENYVYTDVRRERLAELIAEGQWFAIDAIATGEGEWRLPSEHPAFEDVRRRSADEAHRLLESAPESQSREIDLEEFEEQSEASRSPSPESATSPDSGTEGATRDSPGAPAEPGSSNATAPNGPSTPTADSPPDSNRTPVLNEGSRDRSRAVLSLAGLLLVLAALIAVYTFQQSRSSDDPTSPTSNGAAEAATAETNDAGTAYPLVRRARDRARERVAEAVAVDPSDPRLQESVANRLQRNGESDRASRILGVLWEDRSGDPAFAERYIDVLIEAGRWERARSTAIDALQRFDSAEPFREDYASTLEKQPGLRDYRPVDLGGRGDVSVLRPAERGDYPAYEVYGPDGDRRYLFVPSAESLPDWRDQIAAWRLCELLECGFEIPETSAARIDRASLDRLLESDRTSGPVPPRAELHWIDGDDGDVLRGALRRWPEEIERWPIEAVSLWRPWTAGYADATARETTVAEALDDRTDLDLSSESRRSIRDTTGEWTIRRTTRQLSNILTFDFLTNNWGRFEDDPDQFGASHHVGSDGFVTLRSETVFQNRSSRRVEDRFNWCSRFSRDFVTSLRLLKRDRTESILYPEPGVRSEGKFQLFWRQRERALDRIDELSEASSADRVVAFE